MRKRILFTVIAMLLLALTGCAGSTTEKNLRVNTMDLTGLPEVEIAYVNDPDFQKQTPEQELVTKTKGHIADYIVQDGCAYYIVVYDFMYRDYCEQYAVYKQAFSDQKLEQCAEETFAQGYDDVQAGYDQHVYWTALGEDGVMHRFDVVDGAVTETTVSDETVAADDSWKQEIGDSELLANTNLVAANDQYIVWEQWQDDAVVSEDAQICVYQKKNKVCKVIHKKEYGSVYTPKVIGDCMVFLTSDDIQSYTADGDSYDNVYMVQLDTMDIKRITENSGKEDAVKTISYDNVHASDGAVYFTSQVHAGENTEYDKLHYMRVRE